jgi:hypothetical protein
VTENLIEPDADSLAFSQLEALASCLEGRGFEAHVSRDGGALSLNVINRVAPSCHENITACLAEDSTWWFWWSWGDRIARTTDVEAAAFKIAYVLTLRAGG